jgi:hypothetical protein
MAWLLDHGADELVEKNSTNSADALPKPRPIIRGHALPPPLDDENVVSCVSFKKNYLFHFHNILQNSNVPCR